MLAVALALACSLAWGFSDFIGGLKSRTLAVLTVMLVSQATGLVAIAAIVAARGEEPPDGRFALYAVLASLGGAVGLSALLRGLAIGVMSIVAPLSATGAVIPVVVGVATGERPSTLQLAGLVLAIVGVVLASRSRAEPGEGARSTGAGLALLSALGIGVFFVAIDAAGDDDVFWAILISRVTTVTLMGAVALVVKPDLSLGRGDLRTLCGIGLLDTSANVFFVLAATEGLLSVVGVLSSLYPVVTVVLARFVLGERLARIQAVGIAVAMAGVLLIAGG